MRPLFILVFIAFSFGTRAQNLENKVAKAVQRVYADYKLYFDSNLLAKHVVLDRKKSYLIYNQTQKIKTLAIADDSFVFDEFNLSFAIVYKGDTIRHLPPCRLDTNGTLMALGTPTNPVKHGDLLPPYQQLIKGDIKFDYKKLVKSLQQLKMETIETDLREVNLAGTKLLVWNVTLACPEIKCRVLQFDTNEGKVVFDSKPE